MNMFQVRVRRPRMPSALERAGPIAAALAVALVLVPTASSGTYADPAGDSGGAGDVTGVTVMGDKVSGQVVFRISGTNLASGETNPLFLAIDSDSNPLTGDLTDHGTDYWFGVDLGGYWFGRWDGSRCRPMAGRVRPLRPPRATRAQQSSAHARLWGERPAVARSRFPRRRLVGSG